MEEGVSLVDALEQSPDVLSERAVLALRFASQTGTLSQTYRELLVTERPNHKSNGQHPQSDVIYWVTLAVCILFFACFLMYFISPTLKKIIDEMQTQSPTIFWSLLWVSNKVSMHFGWLLCALGLLFWTATSMAPRRFLRRYIGAWFARPNSESNSIELMRLLALATEAGRPLAGSLSTLARYHFDGRMRQRLLFARNEVEQGVDGWQSLSDAGLFSSQESKAISEMPSNHARAWTLRELATQKTLLRDQRRFTWRALLQPLVTLFFALIVLWLCSGFFGVIVKLIQGLS
jgi:type II secretory pathway component PulF